MPALMALVAATLTTAAAPPYVVSLWHATTRCEEGDVNGIFSYGGVWHIMHQFGNRPRTSIGHQSSTDLLHWTRLPDALESGNATDEQCYDGGVSLVPQAGTGKTVPMLMIDGGCARKGKNGASCMESNGQNTGGVTAFPSDLTDPNLTQWDRVGPTVWEPCNSSAWPSPIWYNKHTAKYNLLAVHEFGEARFEAEDASFTKWKMVDPAFITGIRGLGGGMWHPMPPNVEGIAGRPWATHVFQGALGSAFNGLPNFVMGVYDEESQTFTNVSKPMLIDVGGGVNYGQLSTFGIADPRCLFVSWLRLTEPAPPDCGTQGILTAIRDLRYDPRLDRLVHNPIAEYYSLRSADPFFNKVNQKLVAGAPPQVLYAGTSGIALDVEFNVSVPAEATSTAVARLGLRCESGSGCTKGVTVTVTIGKAANDGSRRVDMLVDYAYHIGSSFTALPGEGYVPVRVLSDVRSVEIFGGFGRSATSITMLSNYSVVTAAATANDVVLTAAAAWGMSL